jgi:hypothetical protein
MKRQPGQVLVFFALVLPLVLLPIAAYAIDAAVASAAYSRLVEVTVLAAEDAANQVDVAALRAGGGIVLDTAAADTAAETDLAALGAARLIEVEATGDLVTLATAEDVSLPLDFVGRGVVTLHASATARIAPGYASPSSRLPLPVSTF